MVVLYTEFVLRYIYGMDSEIRMDRIVPGCTSIGAQSERIGTAS